MISRLSKLKKKTAFTLVELIIVIAIISLLAAIIVVMINPSSLFQNARESTRSNDISTFNTAIQKYIADGPSSKIVRTLNDFDGYAALYASATITTSSQCINGSTGIISVTTPFSISQSGSNSLNLQPLLDNGYISSVMKDPLTKNPYLACIDTANNNQLIIYSSTNETGVLKFTNISSYNPNILAWDSFDRADSSTTLGTADSGQSWITPNSTWGISGNKAKVFTAATTYSSTNKSVAYINIPYSDCIISLNISAYQAGSSNGIAYRVLDGSNYLYTGNSSSTLFLYSFYQNGTYGNTGSYSAIAPRDGDNLKVKLQGNAATIYLNGKQITKELNTFNQTATGHGLSINFANKGLIDNFVITSL